MATVEAAALLFGSEDSSSDPFASLGLIDEASPPPADHSGTTQPNSGYRQETFGQSSDVLASSNVGPGRNGQDEITAYSQPHSSSAGGASYGQTDAPRQSWQGAHDAGVAYDAQASNSWLSGYENQSQYQSTASYTAYAPYSNGSSTTTTSTPLYDPYAPTSTSNATYSPSHQYNSSLPTATANTANTDSRTSPYHAAYQTHMTSPYAVSEQPTIPTPPAPKAPVVRPKIVNAYDPPFPTTKAARRTSSRPTLAQQAPAYNNYTSGVGGPYTDSSQILTNPAYPSPQGGLPSSNGLSNYGGYGIQWNQQQLANPRPPSTTLHPIDGLPAQNDALASQYKPHGTPIIPNNIHQPPHNPYASVPQNAARPSQLNHTPSSDFEVESDLHTTQGSFTHGSPPMVSPAASLMQPIAESRGDDYLNKGSSSRNLSRGSVYSPTQQYAPLSLPAINSAHSPTSSLSSPQSHSRRASYDAIPPKRSYTPDSSSPNLLQRSASPVVQRTYSPSVTSLQRTASPASLAHAPTSDTQSPVLDPYAPKQVNNFASPPTHPPSSYTPTPIPATTNSYGDLRSRSMSTLSNGLVHTSYIPEDPYAPVQTDRRQPFSVNESSYSVSQYSQTHAKDPSSYSHGPPSGYQSTATGEQELILKATQNLYAPSPSLVGSNDPLGRTSARAPIVSFGFGGKLVTCFHGADTLHTGFDVALSAKNSTGVQIRILHELVPQSALNSSAASFPGPLFSDPGTPTTSIVRAGATTQTKNKKARVSQYLEERAEEISRGLGYLHSGSLEGRKEEGKLILIKLLKVLVENDGKLTGSQQIDHAVRTALVPRLETTSTAPMEVTPMIGLGLSSVPDLSEPALTTTTLRPSALDKIQDFLVRGERKQAYHYALDERLWGHALVIASGIDKESWKEAVNEFLKVELGSKPSNGPLGSTPNVTNTGREGLRVAYSLFSGQGAAAVQEMNPHTQLVQIKPTLPLNPITPTPLTPNFSVSTTSAPLPSETLSAWPDTVAMILANPVSPEVSAALTALGDQLASNHWTEAAHVCYLLSPQTSPIGGIGHPSARIVLLGSRSPSVSPSFSKDLDPIIFTEILEFALSLATPTKGQEPFGGFPHLQAYRLIHAISLLELGHIQITNRYCEAITAALSRGSPYFTAPFMEQLKALVDRIVGAPNVDKSGSWIGSKLSKPSLDSIGGWLEGRFTKLVTGDSDAATPEVETKPDSQQYGPFSHYSSISSATQSARSSPQPSLSAYPSQNGHAQIDRASSAMDYIRRKPSPVPRIASASATSTSFSQATSFSPSYQSAYSPIGSNSPEQEIVTPRPTAEDNDGDIQEVGWWGTSSYGQATTNQTPTATTFMKVEAPLSGSTDGFISLMETPSFESAYTSQPNARLQQSHAEEDEDDLGLGNAIKKEAKVEDSQAIPESPSGATPTATQQPGPNSSLDSNGSWFSRWWKKGDKPGPVKANLGEETSFYYDPELKRWVNKKAGAEVATKPAAPPPPPTRARTASPSVNASSPSNGPPPRAASAIDLSTSPPSKTVMRVRSNLAPPPLAESAPSTPTGMRLSANGGPPPPTRPKSQATKRNIRSRYVDVFQAEGGA